MNKLWIALSLCVALAACNKTEQPAAPAAGEQPAAQPAAAAPASAPAADATAAASSDALPTECESYISRVKACVAKAGDAAKAFDQSLDQAKEQWKAISDKTALASACKQANDGFAQAAKALNCD